MVARGRRRRFRASVTILIAVAAAVGLGACSSILGIDYPPLKPDASGVAEAGIDEGGGADHVGEAPIATSCRQLKELRPSAPSGSYALIDRDGGFYCDMESFGGGWTLVRPDMVTEGNTQNVDPSSPNVVDVSRQSSPLGGAGWKVTVTSDDCNRSRPRAFHWFLVGEVDSWQQIMATYTFLEGTDCWSLFGNIVDDRDDLPQMNVRSFDPLVDRFDRAENMQRRADRTAVPFEGWTAYCGPGFENFWRPDYRDEKRTIRVVLRRELPSKLGGLSVATACGKPVWELTDVFVR